MSATESKPTTEEPKECPVCITTYTKTVRRPISCPTCHAESCIQCTQRYLTETAEDAHCMHCRARWGRRFLLTTFNKTWLDTDYQHHRAELLWRREESFLPATMPRVELIVRGRRAMKEVIEPMQEQLAAKQAEMKTRLLALDKSYRIIEKEIGSLETELANTKRSIQRMLRGEEPEPSRAVRADGGAGAAEPEPRRDGGAGGPAAEPEKPKVEFHRKCMHDDCNGWLSTAWRCGVCENYTCATCYANKGKERDAATHICKEEDKATVALLAKDTKSCPNCGMGVQRTEGCPVMFCTSCHKGFNWNTLKIMETGIHNPHYFEWRNRVGILAAPARTMGDIPCGGLPHEQLMYYLPKAEQAYVTCMYRCIQHITDNWFMRQYRVDGIESLELRTKFLLGDSTKKAVQTALARQEKSNELKMALWDCYNTCAVAGSELLREFFAHIETAVRDRGYNRYYNPTVTPVVFNDAFPRSLYETFHRDAEALRIFINKAILDVADVYRSTTGVQVIHSSGGKVWNSFVNLEHVLAIDLEAKDKVERRGILKEADKKATITGEQSPLLAETGFIWHKGDIVSPDAKVLKRGAGTSASGGAGSS